MNTHIPDSRINTTQLAMESYLEHKELAMQLEKENSERAIQASKDAVIAYEKMMVLIMQLPKEEIHKHLEALQCMLVNLEWQQQ